MKNQTQITIQILHEMEKAIEEKLEEIRANNPKLRNGLLYKNNVSDYRNLKDRQRGYEKRRSNLI